MLKRTAIALGLVALTALSLLAIDRASLLVAPCVEYSHENNKDAPKHDECASREGIIVAGIEWLENLKPENWTALATLAIAGFTLTLWLSTNSLAKNSLEQIRLARQEFVATHRPKIIVRFVQGPFSEDDREFVWVTVTNIGETDATIVAIGTDLARRDGPGNWLPPGLGAGLREVTPPSNLASAERLVLRVQSHQLTTEIDETIDAELCAVGRIQYRNANGRLFETQFVRVFNERRGAFLPSTDPEDEYQD